MKIKSNHNNFVHLVGLYTYCIVNNKYPERVSDWSVSFPFARHAGGWGSRRTAPRIVNLGAVCPSFGHHAPAPLLLEKQCPAPTEYEAG